MSRRLILRLTLTLAFVAVFVNFAAGAAGTEPEPQATRTPDVNAITFHNNTMADFSATSGEPIVKVDPTDRIFATSPFGVTTSGSASALVTSVLRVTYNPLLGTTTVERLK